MSLSIESKWNLHWKPLKKVRYPWNDLFDCQQMYVPKRGNDDNESSDKN